MKLFIDWYDYANNRGDVYLCDAPIEDVERNHIASVIRDGTGNECETARNIVEAVNNYDALRAELDAVKAQRDELAASLDNLYSKFHSAMLSLSPEKELHKLYVAATLRKKKAQS